jgi:hypothetical protein
VILRFVRRVCKLLSDGKYDAVISIDSLLGNKKYRGMKLESRKKQLANYCDHILHLRFDDTCDELDYEGPKLYHIERIKEFAETLRGKRVLIHCNIT